MKHHLFIFHVLLYAATCIHAQSNYNNDSLLKELETAIDTNRVNILTALCKTYRHADVVKSISYGENALKLARQLRFSNGMNAALQQLAAAYTEKGNYPEALQLRQQLLQEYKKRKDLFNTGRALHLVAGSYCSIGNYSKALGYYFNSIRYKEKINDEEGIAKTLFHIAITYQDQGNDLLALKYGFSSLAVYKKIKDYSGIAIMSNAIAEIFYNKKNNAEALRYYELSLEATKKINNAHASHAIATALLNLSNLYKDSLNYDKALAYNSEVATIAYEQNDPYIEALSLENCGRIYFSMNKLRQSTRYFLKALDKYRESGAHSEIAMIQNTIARNYLQAGDYKNAERFALNVLEITSEKKMPEYAKESLEILMQSGSETGNYQKAFYYQQQYIKIKDSLLNKEKSKEIAKLEMLYDTEKKEKEIELLKSKTEKELLVHFIIAGVALLIIFAVFMLYKRQRIKNASNRQQFQLQQELTMADLNDTILHKDKLQEELTYRNKELTTSTLHLIQKNSMMQEMKNKIKELQYNTDNTTSKELNKLQHLVSHSTNLDDSWEEFRLYFEKVHQHFLPCLKRTFPALTNKELRLCALIRLNLNIKETTTLLGISSESVKVARYRLRKKLGLSSEESLAGFLLHIDKENFGNPLGRQV